jgi:hypothetical protein
VRGLRILEELSGHPLGSGCHEEGLGARLVCQERFDLAAQRLVAAATGVEEGAPLIDRAFKRCVIQPRDPLPSVGVHNLG